MIFYFSGTGNSQLAAHRIAEQLGDEAVSINRYLKAGETGSFSAAEPWVFVAPVYAWRLPPVVERWIEGSTFEGGRDAYFVFTCGGCSRNAGAYVKRLCERTGLVFRGAADVVMTKNYLAMGSTSPAEECQPLIDAALPRIDRIAARIRAREQLPEQPATLDDKLHSGPLNPLFYAFCVSDKGFAVSERCTSCGMCAARCPLNNVRLVEGKPTWNGTCTHCMACISGCPAEAIEYKQASQGLHRHYIMDDARCRTDGGRSR